MYELIAETVPEAEHIRPHPGHKHVEHCFQIDIKFSEYVTTLRSVLRCFFIVKWDVYVATSNAIWDLFQYIYSAETEEYKNRLCRLPITIELQVMSLGAPYGRPGGLRESGEN
jgi:hypothetical protein